MEKDKGIGRRSTTPEIIQWRDAELSGLPKMIVEIVDEGWRQVMKWGIQIHHPFAWLAFLTEELGELSQAVSEWLYRGGDAEAVRAEAIQVATLALKVAEMVMAAKGIYDEGESENRELEGG